MIVFRIFLSFSQAAIGRLRPYKGMVFRRRKTESSGGT
jgi:hypothetical protein